MSLAKGIILCSSFVLNKVYAYVKHEFTITGGIKLADEFHVGILNLSMRKYEPHMSQLQLL
jgi:hypothetical protein